MELENSLRLANSAEGEEFVFAIWLGREMGAVAGASFGGCVLSAAESAEGAAAREWCSVVVVVGER